MPSAEIIAIGTELLLGETTDTNTRFIARALRELGVDLYRTQTVGDNAGRIAECVRQTVQRAEIVITTGGLGPTVDDPTRQAIADALGVELEFRPELWEQVVERIARYGRTPTENQKRQAYLPKDAIAIENPVGTAPAFIVEVPPSPPAPLPMGKGRKVVISLPGVPREMETLLQTAVLPYLQKRFALHETIQVRSLHVSGIGEGLLDDQIGDLETLANPTVGLTAHSGAVDIRIAAKAGSRAEASRMIASLEADLRTRLGINIYGADDDTLEGVTLEVLAQRGWSLACFDANAQTPLLGRLARAGHPAYLGGNGREVQEEKLVDETEAAQQQYTASAALGLLVHPAEGQSHVYLCLITPRGKEERHLTYGGPPGNAARWGTNLALDWLRRTAQEVP